MVPYEVPYVNNGTVNNGNPTLISPGKLEVPFAKTFQTSFFIRSCKVWNILDSELIDRNTNLSTFRKGLKAYYMRALSNVFNSEDPRTWKSVCFKCKRARSLVVSPSCRY